MKIEELATGSDLFCKVARGEVANRKVITENKTSLAVFDHYPVSKGHTIVVPKRHIASLFEVTEEEILDIYRNIFQAKKVIEDALHRKDLPMPSGYNVGINIGKASGQTVDHLHVHLIPRYEGDVEDPKGGVRGVIPSKQKYSGPPDDSVEDLLK